MYILSSSFFAYDNSTYKPISGKRMRYGPPTCIRDPKVNQVQFAMQITLQA